jgi:hypothetical protein
VSVIDLHSGVCAAALCDSAQSATSAATYFILSPSSADGIRKWMPVSQMHRDYSVKSKGLADGFGKMHIFVCAVHRVFALPWPYPARDAGVVGSISVG